MFLGGGILHSPVGISRWATHALHVVCLVVAISESFFIHFLWLFLLYQQFKPNMRVTPYPPPVLSNHCHQLHPKWCQCQQEIQEVYQNLQCHYHCHCSGCDGVGCCIDMLIGFCFQIGHQNVQECDVKNDQKYVVVLYPHRLGWMSPNAWHKSSGMLFFFAMLEDTMWPIIALQWMGDKVWRPSCNGVWSWQSPYFAT